MMFDYAVQYEITDKNTSRALRINIDNPEKTEPPHIKFSDEEMSILWNNLSLPFVDMILIQCYMGWRPQELCTLLIENVNLDGNYITGGLKTEAGKSRQVPIHPRIKNLIQDYYVKSVDFGSPYLFTLPDANSISYRYYHRKFLQIVEQLHLNPMHKPHDARLTFTSMAKSTR